MIKAIIVDDESFGRKNLNSLIKSYCPSIVVTHLVESVDNALKIINTQHPDVVFLDINMPEQDGFDLLRYRKNWIKDPAIVFVTAYEQFALKALNNSAVYYLMKPIDIDELIKCESKLLMLQPKSIKHEKEPLSIQESKILISDSKSIRFINIDDIIYLKAYKNYTIVFYYESNSIHSLIATNTLRDFGQLLSCYIFFRVHRSYLINVYRIKKYLRNENLVVMIGGTTIEVSRRKSVFFREYIYKHFNSLL